MVDYILEVYNVNTTTGRWTRIGEITTYYNLTWNRKSNNPSYCTFSINVYSPDSKFIKPFRNWVLLKRNGIPYLFQIINVRGDLNETSGYLEVECADMLYCLDNIYVQGNFQNINIDAGQIAVNLINYAQSKLYSNYGIQTGTIDTVGTSNETLYYQSIGKALTNQSDNIIGYDFTFVPILDANNEINYVQFNVFKALGIYRNDLPPLELGHSINSLRFGMADEVFNNIYTLGTGTNEVQVATSTNATSQEIFGNRESVNKEANVSVLATLQKKGDSFLNDKQGIQLEIGFNLTPNQKPYYGDFGLYDTLDINVVIGDTFFNFTGTATVKEIQFRYDNTNNKETITPIVKFYKI